VDTIGRRERDALVIVASMLGIQDPPRTRWGAVAQASPGQRGDGASVQKARPIVLLVEDDFDLRDALTDRLDEAGFDVRSAGDGRQALAAIELKRPDVVVTDLMMPEMSGWDLIGELGRRPDLRQIPIIVITAAGNAPVVPLGHPVFVKPVRTDALVRAIQALVPPPS
jgi:CheY-like chemotaxis protein